MSRKTNKPEQITGMLREAEIRLSHGRTVEESCRGFGVSGQSYYRWRREHGGVEVSQTHRLKELENENARLSKAVSGLTLDKLILNEALTGLNT
ncbi:transposase [Hoeflea poritis]|uniref:Transposase n=1 Tax=Hoeflea poritis TaxID=2993659 RepID=A0ABT4VV23_9HYPH|nr:transposase [Hoeflea poritis]MDA4848555.1 transposase [Hoeflea poritis]